MDLARFLAWVGVQVVMCAATFLAVTALVLCEVGSALKAFCIERK